MAHERVQRRLTTVLAADVVGYSRLMGEDEAGTLAALKHRRREVLAPKLSARPYVYTQCKRSAAERSVWLA